MIHKETIMQTNNHKIVDYDTVLDKNGKPVITPPSEIIEKKTSKHRFVLLKELQDFIQIPSLRTIRLCVTITQGDDCHYGFALWNVHQPA